MIFLVNGYYIGTHEKDRVNEGSEPLGKRFCKRVLSIKSNPNGEVNIWTVTIISCDLQSLRGLLGGL